jgi:hypothetical protein
MTRVGSQRHGKKKIYESMNERMKQYMKREETNERSVYIKVFIFVGLFFVVS